MQPIKITNYFSATIRILILLFFTFVFVIAVIVAFHEPKSFIFLLISTLTFTISVMYCFTLPVVIFIGDTIQVFYFFLKKTYTWEDIVSANFAAEETRYRGITVSKYWTVHFLLKKSGIQLALLKTKINRQQAEALVPLLMQHQKLAPLPDQIQLKNAPTQGSDPGIPQNER